jgi:uncharacterized protein (DUF58 family)
MKGKQSLLRRMLTARGRSLEITRAGWLFILLTLAVGFAAINSGSNLLHAIFGAQMALIIGSGVLSERTVRRTEATRIPGLTLHAMTPAPVRVEIRNVHPTADLLSVSVEDDERWDGEGKCEPAFAVRLPAGGAVELTTTVTMPHRGRHRLPPAVVSTRFPFGLFVKRRELAPPRLVTIYPRVMPVPLHGGLRHRPGAGEASGRRARVGEFYGLREYREGDDPQRIYWKASARGRGPVLREHEALGDTEVVLELHAGRTGDAAFEREVEHVASLAVAHLREPGVAVGLRYAGELVVPPTSGAHGRRELLECLAVVGGAA